MDLSDDAFHTHSTRHHSQLPNLRKLDLSENPLFQADGVRELLSFLKTTNLRSLGLARCGLSNHAAKYLRYGASKLPEQLEDLDLDGNLFDDEGARSIGALIKTVVKHRRKNKNKAAFNIVLTTNCKRVTERGIQHIRTAALESIL